MRRLAWSARWPAGERSPCAPRSPRCSSVCSRRPLRRPRAPAAAPQSPPPKAFIVVDVDDGHGARGRPRARRAAAGEHVEGHDRAHRGRAPRAGRTGQRQPARRVAAREPHQHAGRASNGRSNNALASLLMASANDAAYAIAETAGGSLDGFVAADAADRGPPRHGGQHVRRPGRPRRRDVVQGRAPDERVRHRDRDPQRARGARDRAVGATAEVRVRRSDRPARARSRTTTGCCPAAPAPTSAPPASRPASPSRAGHTLVATATRDGRSLIAVILDTYDTYGWAVQLLDQGFATPNEQGTGEVLPGRRGESVCGPRRRSAGVPHRGARPRDLDADDCARRHRRSEHRVAPRRRPPSRRRPSRRPPSRRRRASSTAMRSPRSRRPTTAAVEVAARSASRC